MLDRYLIGEAARISPEAPIPIIALADAMDYAGGAANVAVTCAALGAETSLLAFIGDDLEGASLQRLVAESGVEACWMHATAPTTLKLRVLSGRQHVARVDREAGIEDADHDTLVAKAIALLHGCDLVVLSDYGKGGLTRAAALIAACHAAGKPVLVDPKGRDFDRYVGAYLVKPNQAEFETVAGVATDESDFEARASALRRRLACRHLVVTRGARGLFIAGEESCLEVPASQVAAVDITGAGDAAMAGLAVGLARGEEIEAAARFAVKVAGLAVSRPGTVAVSLVDMDEEGNPLERIARARRAGEKIVMTNGCFDLLHAGHLHCLERARALGDRLVVALDDDASVSRLKGAGRPLVPLAQRLTMLRALRCVDFVIPFGGAAPDAVLEELIRAIAPDVLVKGGDHTTEAVVGGEAVRAAGGVVTIVPRLPGFSTTELCQRAAGSQLRGSIR